MAQIISPPASDLAYFQHIYSINPQVPFGLEVSWGNSFMVAGYSLRFGCYLSGFYFIRGSSRVRAPSACIRYKTFGLLELGVAK